MNWNHRVVQFDRENEPPLLVLQEVYYDSKGKPYAYSDPFMCGDSIKELEELVGYFASALRAPIINSTDLVRADPKACALCGEVHQP